MIIMVVIIILRCKEHRIWALQRVLFQAKHLQYHNTCLLVLSVVLFVQGVHQLTLERPAYLSYTGTQCKHLSSVSDSLTRNIYKLQKW